MITNIMKELEFQDFIILIGKNKYENASLLENADPHDYWIHIKDYSSGHVIIKNPRRKKVPTNVIKRACCILKSSNSRCKSIKNLEFCVAKRESLTLTTILGEVIVENSKNITI